MTTALQKEVLEAIALNGPMNFAELETACLIEAKRRGGFRSAVNSLFQRKLLDADENEMWLTVAGAALHGGLSQRRESSKDV